MKPEMELVECLDCSCFAVRRAARVITQHYDRHLRPAGLRATQFTVLVVLALEGRTPLGRLAERIGTERTTLTRNLRLLTARGLVASETGKDRRVLVLRATAKGVAAARSALPRWREAQWSVADHFTAPTLRALKRAEQAASGSHPSRARVTAQRRKEG